MKTSPRDPSLYQAWVEAVSPRHGPADHRWLSICVPSCSVTEATIFPRADHQGPLQGGWGF